MTAVAVVAPGAPLWQGTLVFLLIWLGVGVVGQCVGMGGKLWTRKETRCVCRDGRRRARDTDASPLSRSLVWLLSFLAIFCMWLMWICMWLMQWHPVVVPRATPAEVYGSRRVL